MFPLCLQHFSASFLVCSVLPSIYGTSFPVQSLLTLNTNLAHLKSQESRVDFSLHWCLSDFCFSEIHLFPSPALYHVVTMPSLSPVAYRWLSLNPTTLVIVTHQLAFTLSSAFFLSVSFHRRVSPQSVPFPH